MTDRRVLLPLTVALALTTGVTAVASPAHRTFRLTTSLGGGPVDGPVSDASLSGSANAAVFVTPAGNFVDSPTAGVANVMAIDLPSGRRWLVSRAPDGSPADGPSRSPAISDSGRVVAFASDASNLVSGDGNGVSDVFVATRGGGIVRASVADDGTEANGPSTQPDISSDGRFVAFTSSATNLVPGDTNGQPDVFVRDLVRNTTTRVSITTGGAEGNGPSGAPAISADGATVAYQSSASNLVPGDTNGVADVFTHGANGVTERVSVSSAGVQQDKAIAAPFSSTPDISGDGRYVVFDSDATTLYAGDRNQHTDVYLRDRRRGTTTLVSASSLNVQGNNDSVTPRITANGRFVSFQSFASNLVRDDGPGEDLFVRDLRDGTTALVNATDSGARRVAEPGGQLLQRPSVADDGRAAIFLSAAANVVAPFAASPVQLYVRALTAPALTVSGPILRANGVVRLRVQADDPAATRLLCRVDRSRPRYCGPNLAFRATAGRILTVRAGGPGMLWSAAQRITLPHG